MRFITSLTVRCCAVLALLPALEAAERPNLVVFMADDLGYGDIGCFGNTRIDTPSLDRLASEGMRLTDFHSSGVVCSPTRAGLLTGRYQQRAGIPTVIFADPKQPTHPHGLQDRELTFAELLRDAGYATAIFGKWHLGYYKQYNPVRHGFTQFRGYVSGNVDFFSHIDQAGRLDWWRNEEIDDEPGYTTHLITKHALAFIAANQDRPFCLYVPYEPPHYPYQGPRDKPLRKVGTGRGRSESQQSGEDVQHAYKEMVEEMDTGIGQIVSSLKQLDLDRRTLVMFFSDNGATPRGSNGALRGHKGQVWEGGHRVPCIAWWPEKIEANRVAADLTITLDVMPTLLAAAGVKPPDHNPLDGVDLLPLLTEGRSIDARRLFWMHGRQDRKLRAMRDGHWKLVDNAPGRQRPQLFHVAHDIGERNNLALQEPRRVNEMLAAIEAWEQETTSHATPQPDVPPLNGS